MPKFTVLVDHTMIQVHRTEIEANTADYAAYLALQLFRRGDRAGFVPHETRRHSEVGSVEEAT